MPPALAAIAPVVASGVSSLVKHKQASSAAKQQAEYERQQAAAEEAQRKAMWEAQQASPEAAMRRQSFTMRLGKLLGSAGGREKLPPSLLEAYDVGRRMPTYTPGGGYIPKPTGGGGIWDVLGGATEALSYLDINKLKGKPKAPTSPGQPVGEAPTGGAFQTGQLADLLRQRKPITPFNPMIGG